MSHSPLADAPSLFEALDLSAIADELLVAAGDAADGKASRTMLKSATSTLVLIALRRGARLAEHSAPSTVVIVPIRGHVTFTTPIVDAAAQVVGSQCLV